jgi:hypothetical protein
MACNRRRGGSAKDVYDLYLWSQPPFDQGLVRRVAVLKAWTDQRSARRFDPANFIAGVAPQNYRWEDLRGLVPRRWSQTHRQSAQLLRTGSPFSRTVVNKSKSFLKDQSSHRERELFIRLRRAAKGFSRQSTV